jgi:hypothetical protein
VDWQEMNYGTSEAMTIVCGIRFDNAIQTRGGGVGTTVLSQTFVPGGVGLATG